MATAILTHELLDLEQQSSAFLDQVDETVLSRKDKTKPYMDAFTKWCEKTGVAPTVPRLIQWDESFNHGKIQVLFGTVEEQLEVAQRTLYSRVFYTYYRIVVAVGQRQASIGNKLYKPESKVANLVTSLAQKGTFIPTMDIDQKAYLLDSIHREFRNMVNKVVLFGIPLEKLQLMLAEVISETHQ